MLATTPSGSWPMRSVMPASANTVSSAQRALDLGRGRSRSGRAGRRARCATARSACRPRPSASRPASRSRPRRAARKRAMHACALGQRPRRPRRLRGARARRLGGDARGVVGRHLGDRRAGGRVGDPQGGSSRCCGGASAAARKSSSSGVSSSVPSPRRWNSGAIAPPPCSCRRAGGPPRSCRRPGSAPRRRSRARDP